MDAVVALDGLRLGDNRPAGAPAAADAAAGNSPAHRGAAPTLAAQVARLCADKRRAFEHRWQPLE